MMSVEIRDERFKQVVGEGIELEQVATNFIFTEGAMWNGATRELVFSDMPGDIMRKWSAESGISVLRQPSSKTNGNYYDLEGRLISCEHATNRVVREEANGTLSVLATHYEGKELNSPNDVIVKSDGAIYFTDPTYGRMDVFGLLGFQMAYQNLRGDIWDGNMFSNQANQSFQSELGLKKSISKIKTAKLFYQQLNVPNPFEFEFTESTVMGYRIGIELGSGMVLNYTYQRTFRMSSDGKLEPVNLTGIETSFTF